MKKFIFLSAIWGISIYLVSCGGSSKSNNVSNDNIPTEYCEELVKLAEDGNAKAQGRLAMIFYEGKGVNRDDASAAKWAKLADGQGNPYATYILACLTLEGAGIPRNVDEGMRLLEKSADGGVKRAAATLGYTLLYGGMAGGSIKVQQDIPKAIKYLKIGAENGEPQAQEALAPLYVKGIVIDGVSILPKDPEKSFELSLQAAENEVGYPAYDAEWAVGTCYMNGIGTEVDYEKGLSWLKRAASHGNSLAIEDLQKYSNLQ